ncbi:Mobile element protein [Candidatus Enterovibrio escicola]|uniref:Mobile element protein n=1 Tax=Candidatus Enterovibrio escicola TaxID=1927127 RepID=A0A2A5SZ99_9GAMM|nr:transposase [Candidatus Enterovibrio escacola]PCS21249.1 Mobile element protein [Candidatus Enterovibrio escacola]
MFYGFKLHLIINDQGSVILVKVTIANVDDRESVSKMAEELWGCLYGDIRLYLWSMGARICRQGSDIDNGCKKYENQSDETLESPDVPGNNLLFKPFLTN